MTLPFTAPDYLAPNGPRWVPGATEIPATIQVDGRGTRWIVWAIREGGRVIDWRTTFDTPGPVRRATTTATPAHPQYLSDETVAAAARAAKREAKARRMGRGYP